MPVAGLHVPAVARQDSLLLEELPIPYPYRPVVGTAAELRIRRGEFETTNGIAAVRPQQLLDGRHRRLPIFNGALGITTQDGGT